MRWLRGSAGSRAVWGAGLALCACARVRVRVMGHRRRTSDGRRCGLDLRQLCALTLPVVLPCVIELDVDGESCAVVQSLTVEVESSDYCDALCGDSSCAATPRHDRPSLRHREPAATHRS
eukprot:COSAG02_NODE_9390_length_2233_cov_1.690722_2_plen_120_part_00